jgi:hypothetical protein
MSEYRPNQADDARFYNWAMEKMHGPGFPKLPAGKIDIDLDWYKWALKTIYGDKCHICGMSVNERKHRWPAMRDWLLEHRNGDPKDYRPENLQLSCYSCNQLKRPDLQKGPPAIGKSERENTIAGPSDENSNRIEQTEGMSEAEQSRKRRQLKNAPIEIQISQRAEPKIRRYIIEQASRPEGLFLDDAVNESAEIAECDVQTASRKIAKMCSRAGPLFKEALASGEEILRLKTDYVPDVNTATGRLDYETMLRMKQKTEIESREIKQKSEMQVNALHANLKASEQANSVMRENLQRNVKQRTLFAAMLEALTGRKLDDLLQLISAKTGKTLEDLEKMNPPALAALLKDFDRDDNPAAPVAKDDSGDQPPAAPAQTVGGPYH